MMNIHCARFCDIRWLYKIMGSSGRARRSYIEVENLMAAPYVCTISIILLAFCSPPPSCLAAEQPVLMTWNCNNRTYYAPNTTYQSNVRSLVSSLAANASGSSPVGFATATLGAGLDMVWGLALCRGDTDGTECASCLALAPGVAFNKCQGAKDVSVFYDRCLLRYSDMDFRASPDNTQVLVYGSNKEIVTSGSADRFNALAAYLVGALSDLAAFNTTTRYAVGVVTSDLGFPTTWSDVVHSINGMVQCTPDQAPRACRGCLQALMDEMPAMFNGSVGWRITGVWCQLRYEVKEFYDGSPMVRLAAPSWTPPSSTKKGNGTMGRENAATAIAVVFGVVVILLSIFTMYLWRNAKANKSQALPNAEDDRAATAEDDHAGSLLFDLATLIHATANFAQENKLGHGGFGAVYKGILPDGREIAVKRLDKASSQGLKELRNELLLVAKLRHNNLAKLLGVCFKGQEKLLVYEYLPNRSLDTFLFEVEKRELLDWGTRYNIFYGTARGLLYLHEDSQIKIIHRDLKASNILLDANMNPKISDFGLARLFDSDKTSTITSQVVGTIGYMAPEYAVLGHLSVKLDIYSFGVIVLEIVSGRRNTDVFESTEESDTLLSYVWANWTRGTPLEIMDPALVGCQAPESEVLKCIHLALLCVQENPADRPTMLSVLVMLHGESSSFPAPSKPAFAFSLGSPGDQRASPPVSVNCTTMSEFHPR